MPHFHSRTYLALLSLSLATITCLAFSPITVSPPLHAPDTPDEAISALMAGNKRYAEDKTTSRNTSSDRAELAAGQAPFAAVIRCADSRVAPEIVFDQPLGKLFVCAVAGNIPTPDIIASLEYTVAVLGSKLIVVMGHSSCGAVEAAITHRDDSSALPGSLPMLIDQIIIPCALEVDVDDPDALSKAITCNANMGTKELMKSSVIIKDAVDKGDLKIIAGVQDLKTGKFTITKQ